MQGIAFLLTLTLLAGCGTGGAGTIADGGTTIAKAPVSLQLIVKFAPDTFACDPAGIARLSLAMRVSLEFVRTMSGGACVVKQSADSQDDLARGRETLERHPAVEYLEPDAVMKAH